MTRINGTRRGKITDLDQYLTATSGLDAKQREQWRDKIAELSASGDKAEAFRVFQSFSYWKTKYATA